MYNFFFIYLSTTRLLFNSANGFIYIIYIYTPIPLRNTPQHPLYIWLNYLTTAYCLLNTE